VLFDIEVDSFTEKSEEGLCAGLVTYALLSVFSLWQKFVTYMKTGGTGLSNALMQKDSN
jgi:hypothetical protein